MPAWSDAGWAGYFYVYNTRSMLWTGMMKTSNATLARASLNSFFSFITSTPGLNYTTTLESVLPTFYTYYNIISTTHNNPIYGNMLTGSWLMPRENFVGQRKVAQHTKAVLEVVKRNEGGYLLFMFVAGGAVSQNSELKKKFIVFSVTNILSIKTTEYL